MRNHVKLGIFLRVRYFAVDTGHGLGKSLGDCRPALPKGWKYQMVNLIPTKLTGYVNHQGGIESAPTQAPFKQIPAPSFLWVSSLASAVQWLRRYTSSPKVPSSNPGAIQFFFFKKMYTGGENIFILTLCHQIHVWIMILLLSHSNFEKKNSEKFFWTFFLDFFFRIFFGNFFSENFFLEFFLWKSF